MATSLSTSLAPPRALAPAVDASRAAATATAAAGVAIAVLVGVVTYTGNDPGNAGTAVLRAGMVLLPIAVGVFLWTRPPERRFGRLLVAGGFVAALAALGGADDELLYSVARLATWLSEVILVGLILAFPSGHVRRRGDRALLVAITVVVVTLFAPTALLTDAFPVPSVWTTCTAGCPANAFQVVAHEPRWVEDVVLPLREVLASLLFVAVTLRLLARTARATIPMRRTLSPVLLTTVLSVAALPVAFALRRSGGDPILPIWILAAGLPVMALGFLVGAMRWRLAIADALQRLPASLQAAGGADGPRAALAEALEDPTLALVYPATGGGWLDAGGTTVALPPKDSGQVATVIHGTLGPVAAIVHDEALCDQRGFVEAAGAFALLALANQRLAAEVEQSLQELRSSRERIVVAADAERRRIERDLHDGAQQRLVALRIKLELASELSEQDRGPGAAQLRALGEEVGDALEEVRSLAAGVYPSVLADLGLEAALRTAARSSEPPATLAADGVRRHTAEVEAAVYFSCLEGLQNAAKHAEARTIAIILTDHDELRFEVRDDGIGFDNSRAFDGQGLTNIRDRLAAVGGHVTVESAAGAGTRLLGAVSVPPPA